VNHQETIARIKNRQRTFSENKIFWLKNPEVERDAPDGIALAKGFMEDRICVVLFRLTAHLQVYKIELITFDCFLGE
jgi:hypothetical protein